jgi:hypothetical protein
MRWPIWTKLTTRSIQAVTAVDEMHAIVVSEIELIEYPSNDPYLLLGQRYSLSVMFSIVRWLHS